MMERWNWHLDSICARGTCKQFACAHMCAWAYTSNTYPTLEERILSFVQSRLCISVDTLKFAVCHRLQSEAKETKAKRNVAPVSPCTILPHRGIVTWMQKRNLTIMIDKMSRGETDRGWAWIIVAGVTIINVSFLSIFFIPPFFVSFFLKQHSTILFVFLFIYRLHKDE